MRLIIGFIALFSLAACVPNPNDSVLLPTITVAEREAKLKAFKTWRALGSIAVESQEQGKFNASFSWDVKSQGFEIKLFGPLGVQVFHLIENQDGAQLIDRSGQVAGDTAEQLLQIALGTPVPLSKMQSWAVGLPGDAKSVERDDTGKLSEIVVFESTGIKWNVNFKRYTVVDDLELPRQVIVNSDDVLIKLKFKKWSRTDSGSSDRLTIPGVGS